MVIVLIIFGAGKLPEIGGAIGKGINSFKKSIKEPGEIDVTPKGDRRSLRHPEDMAGVAFIGAGSNMDSLENLLSGLKRIIRNERAALVALSSFYRTAPVSPVSQDDYLNCALKVEWQGSPRELLAFLQAVEDERNRSRTVRLDPRPRSRHTFFRRYDNGRAGAHDTPSKGAREKVHHRPVPGDRAGPCPPRFRTASLRMA